MIYFTDIQTTVGTVTSCTDDQCSETPVTTGLTVVTEEETVCTTHWPLTTSPSVPAGIYLLQLTLKPLLLLLLHVVETNVQKKQ